MNSVHVEIEIDLPDGVNIRGYERHKGAHVFEVGFELLSRCTCSKCGHEADGQLRYKDEMLVVRDLDLFGQPSFWTYQAVLHQCPRCRQRTQIPTPFKRPHVTYTYRFEQYVLDQLVSASMEEVALRLLDMIPELELAYCFREDVAEIFDTAKNRQEAAQRLDELRGVVEQEPELGRFFAMYDRWQNGILAYFDRHETSAAVEGLNTKARVITRRSYGLKSAHSLWSRLVLDVNRATGQHAAP